MDTIVEQEIPYPRGEGYLTYLGYLQLVAGALTMLFSLMTVGLAIFSKDPFWMNPAEVVRNIGPQEWSIFMKLMTGFVAFQFAYGWIFGLSLLLGGILCLKRRARAVVTGVAILNLINFPHGTTVGLIMIHGMTRRGIAGAFRRD